MSIPVINIYNTPCGCGSGKVVASCGCSSTQNQFPVQSLPCATIPCDAEDECPESYNLNCVKIPIDMPQYGISKGDPLTALINWILQALNNVGLNPSVLPPLAAPVISALTSNLANTLNVTFLAVPNATAYDIYVRVASTDALVGVFPGTPGLNNVLVPTTGIGYEVQIVAKATGYSNSITAAWSTVVAGANIPAVPQLAVPGISGLNNNGDSEVNIASFSTVPNATSYDIYVRRKSDARLDVIVPDAVAAQPYAIQVPDPGVDYEIQVVAKATGYTNAPTNAGWQTVSVRPASPLGVLVVSAITTTTVNLNWNPSTHATDYVITYHVVGAGGPVTVTTGNNTPFKQLTGLTANTSYEVRAFATNATGDSIGFVVATFKTAP